MSAVTFTLDFTGTPDSDDILAARYIIEVENRRRTAANVVLAAEVPPGTPLTLLPFATGPQLKASYLGLFVATVTIAHLSNIMQAKLPTALLLHFTESQLLQIAASLATRINAGETPAALLADIAT